MNTPSNLERYFRVWPTAQLTHEPTSTTYHFASLLHLSNSWCPINGLKAKDNKFAIVTVCLGNIKEHWLIHKVNINLPIYAFSGKLIIVCFCSFWKDSDSLKQYELCWHPVATVRFDYLRKNCKVCLFFFFFCLAFYCHI